jgi:hypothetical protein
MLRVYISIGKYFVGFSINNDNFICYLKKFRKILIHIHGFYLGTGLQIAVKYRIKTVSARLAAYTLSSGKAKFVGL